MTAKGIPSVCLWSTGDWFWPRIYHTNYENESLVDYAFLGNNTKFIFRIGQALDKGLLPYSLEARADDLAGTVSGSALSGAGCSAAAVSRFTTAVGAFQSAAGAYEARRASIPASAGRPSTRPCSASRSTPTRRSPASAAGTRRCTRTSRRWPIRST